MALGATGIQISPLGIDNAGALGWRLSPEQVQALDRASMLAAS